MALDFAGYYGPVADHEIMQLLAALRGISCGNDYLLLIINHDSTSVDQACTPLFIGSPEQLATAQLRYGICALRA
ncbi:hypothetical protein [Rugamonas aquatica]|uniref:Uncharacterized protein n=1 Tax=Rugamonas aquatica TaxID=2743357 RepID=A0A6A7N685_9BURK|nr:hypothetical protein [Rugamonas aquatica]MQA40560.1 hypothetical protein [Rugamonas aquatica]